MIPNRLRVVRGEFFYFVCETHGLGWFGIDNHNAIKQIASLSVFCLYALAAEPNETSTLASDRNFKGRLLFKSWNRDAGSFHGLLYGNGEIDNQAFLFNAEVWVVCELNNQNDLFVAFLFISKANDASGPRARRYLNGNLSFSARFRNFNSFMNTANGFFNTERELDK